MSALCSEISGEPRGITADSSGNLYVVTKDEEIYKSLNDGVDWSLLNDSFTDKDCANQYAFEYESLSTNLSFYVRSCDDASCSGESWVDIADSSPQDLSLDDNRYFQYKSR